MKKNTSQQMANKNENNNTENNLTPFELAKKHFLQGKLFKAQKNFEKLIEAKDPLHLLWYALVLFSLRKLPQACKQCEAAIEIVKENGNYHVFYMAHFLLGNLYLLQRQVDNAKEGYAKALSCLIDHVSMSENNDFVSQQKIIFRNFITEEKKLFIHNIQNVQDAYHSGNFYMLLGQYSNALNAYGMVLEGLKDEQIDDAIELRPHVNYLTGICYFRQKKYVQAVSRFEKIPSDHYLHLRGRVYAARASAKITKEIAEISKEELKKIINNEEQKSAEIYFIQGEVYQRCEMYLEAIASYQIAAQLDPYNFLVYLKMGEVYMANQEHQNALDALTQYLNKTEEEDKGEIYVLIAACHDNLGEYQQALNYAKRAKSLKADSQLLRYIMAHAPFKLEQWREAVAAYREYIKVEDGKVSEQVWTELGYCYQGLNKYIEAIDCYDKAQQLSPNASEILFARATAYASLAKRGGNQTIAPQQYYEKAFVDLNTAIQIEPTKADFYYLLGVICFNSDKLLLAFKNFSKVEYMSGPFPELTQYLSQIEQALTATSNKVAAEVRPPEVENKVTVNKVVEDVKHSEVKNEVAVLEEELKSVRLQLKNSQASLSQREKDLAEKEKKIRKNEKQITDLTNTESQLRQNLKSLRSESQQLQESLAKSEKEAKISLKKLETQRILLQETEKKLYEQTAKITERDAEISQLKQKNLVADMSLVEKKPMENIQAPAKSTLTEPSNNNENTELLIPLRPLSWARAAFLEEKQTAWLLRKEAKDYMQRFVDKGYNIFLVGGGVRSLDPNDLDFISDCPPDKLQEIDKNFSGSPDRKDLFQSFYTSDSASFKIDMSFRSTKIFKSRLALQEDARKRGISMNAVYVDHEGNIYDPCGGAMDLSKDPQEVRFIVLTREFLVKEPTYLLRALNLASEPGRELEEKTEKLIKNNIDLLDKIEPKVINLELSKIFFRGYASTALPLFRSLGFMEKLFAGVAEVLKENHQINAWLNNILAYIDVEISKAKADKDVSKKNNKSISYDYVYLAFLACKLANSLNNETAIDLRPLAEKAIKECDKVVFYDKEPVELLMSLVRNAWQFMQLANNDKSLSTKNKEVGSQAWCEFWEGNKATSVSESLNQISQDQTSNLQHQT